MLTGLCAVLIWHILMPFSQPWAGHISFGRKMFFDSAENRGDGYVEVTGALAGEGLGYQDNATTISCRKDREECLVVAAEQIGSNQIGRLEGPTSYPVIKWDKYEIVASSGDDSNACAKVTISLDRQGKTALWVEQPTNQDRSFCQQADTKIHKWTIDDPPFAKLLDHAISQKR
jgi:hypothetical protein